jgi:hypothetical protein
MNNIDDVRPPDRDLGIQEPLIGPGAHRAPREDELPVDADIPESQMFFPWFVRQEIMEGNYADAHRVMKCYGSLWTVFGFYSIFRIKAYW